MPLLTPTIQPDSAELTSDETPVVPVVGVDRLRILLASALWPLINIYLAVTAVLALIIATASAAEFSVTGVLKAAGPSWLAMYQVPLEITGHQLGVLPLLGTIATCAVVTRTAANAAVKLSFRHPSQIVVLVAAIAGAHALFGLAIALLTKGNPITADPFTAFAVPGLIAGFFATIGALSRCGMPELSRRYFDPVVLSGVRAGGLGMAGLLACGALVFLVSLLVSASTVHQIFMAGAPGPGSGLGMLLLSVIYLPNAMVLALSFAVGPGFSIGGVSLAPYAYSSGPMPGLPLFASVPAHAAGWWSLLAALPLLVGALVGWSLRRCDDRPLARMRAVFIAGALVGFGCVLLGTFAGGRLGGGLFDPITVPVAYLSLAAFLLIVLPGAAIAWFAGPQPKPTAPAVTVSSESETEVGADTEEVDTEEVDTEEVDTEEKAQTEDSAEESTESEGAAAEDDPEYDAAEQDDLEQDEVDPETDDHDLTEQDSALTTTSEEPAEYAASSEMVEPEATETDQDGPENPAEELNVTDAQTTAEVVEKEPDTADEEPSSGPVSDSLRAVLDKSDDQEQSKPEPPSKLEPQ